MSKAKYFPYLLIIILAIILWVINRNRNDPSPKPQNRPATRSAKKNTSKDRENSGGLDRDATKLVITKHARCRMACRHITLAEVKGVLNTGQINYRKSEIDNTPEYALEGYSKDRQHIRIVVAPEKEDLILITCIDLDKDWECNCN